MTRTEISYFNAAKAMSELSDHKQYKLGCVVVDRHKIISSGRNSHSRTHSIQAQIDTRRFGCTCPGYKHAEVDALIPLIRRGVDLSKASIYVYRQHKDGRLAMAKPCCGCEQLIKECKIKKIYYSIENGFAQEKW
jgi:deoxycytidylate deaminase